MKPLATVVALTVCTGLAPYALTDDLYPPDWRTDPPGQGATTLQIWEFATDANPAAPDVVFNDFGDPAATVIGDPGIAQWLPEVFGHTGVWLFEDWIELQIPNNPEPREIKHIWLQMTFSATADRDPEILSLPDWSEIEVVNRVQLDDHFYHGTYHITIEPNPADETLLIMPRDCELYLDEIVVDTWCVPEPSSLALLAALGALLSRRR